MTSDFLPEGYKIPKEEKFLRFKNPGIYKFRVLCPPTLGWLDWKDNKPLRFRMDAKPIRPISADKPIRHFWAMKVWNLDKKKIQVIEITQNSIMGEIERYAKMQEYGNPMNYDIMMEHVVDNGKHSYKVAPLPPKPASDEVQKADCETIVNLEAMFDGKDPFAIDDGFPA